MVVRCMDDGGGASGTGRFVSTGFSFGGVCRYAGVLVADVPGVFAFGER
jgi:hypothetical protein